MQMISTFLNGCRLRAWSAELTPVASTVVECWRAWGIGSLCVTHHGSRVISAKIFTFCSFYIPCISLKQLDVGPIRKDFKKSQIEITELIFHETYLYKWQHLLTNFGVDDRHLVRADEISPETRPRCVDACDIKFLLTPSHNTGD